MAALSFAVTQPVFDAISGAMIAYNQFNPSDILATENDFAKRGFQNFLGIYVNRYRQIRLTSIQDKLLNTDTGTWNQITGLLG